MKTTIVLAIEFNPAQEWGIIVEDQRHYPDALVEALELAIAKWNEEHGLKIKEVNTSYKIEH